MSISSLVQPEPTPAETNEAQFNHADTATPEATTNAWLPPVTESEQESVVVEQENKASVGDAFLEALLNKITPVQETRKTLKVLIFSDPGAGKSSLMGQAPNNLIIDVEDGLASLNNHPDLLGKNVKVLKYKSFEALEMVIHKLHEAPPELADIETLSIDSVSELHKRGLAETMERDWRKNPISNNRYLAETEHHTENNEHIRRLVSSLRDLDRNLIMTAHARTTEPKGQPVKTYPDFSEKLANTIAGIVDIVAYMYIKEVDGVKRRILRFHSNGSITAKTRIGGFPEEMLDPTWNDIWSIFTASN